MAKSLLFLQRYHARYIAAIRVYGVGPDIVECVFEFRVLGHVSAREISGISGSGGEIRSAGNGVLNREIKTLVRRVHRNFGDVISLAVS